MKFEYCEGRKNVNSNFNIESRNDEQSLRELRRM